MLKVLSGINIVIPSLLSQWVFDRPSNTVSSPTLYVRPLPSGTAVLNASGTVTYTPLPGFTGPASFTYTICDAAQPTLCSSTVVSLTVTVVNRGPGSAAGVVVTDTLVRNKLVQLQGTAIPSKGTFDGATGIWAVGGLAVNETVTLVLTARVLAEGVVVNVASVTATGSVDLSPTNNEASACTSVPYTLCVGESLAVSVPSTYQAVKWFLNGSSTPIATGTRPSLRRQEHTPYHP